MNYSDNSVMWLKILLLKNSIDIKRIESQHSDIRCIEGIKRKESIKKRMLLKDSIAMRPAQWIALRMMGRFLMLWPDIIQFGCIMSDVITASQCNAIHWGWAHG